MVTHLRDIGHRVIPVNVRLPRGQRIINALWTVSRERDRWRARFRYGHRAFAARSAIARRAITGPAKDADIILQIGATFSPPECLRIPYTLYCDWNMALSIRHQSAHGLT